MHWIEGSEGACNSSVFPLVRFVTLFRPRRCTRYQSWKFVVLYRKRFVALLRGELILLRQRPAFLHHISRTESAHISFPYLRVSLLHKEFIVVPNIKSGTKLRQRRNIMHPVPLRYRATAVSWVLAERGVIWPVALKGKTGHWLRYRWVPCAKKTMSWAAWLKVNKSTLSGFKKVKRTGKEEAKLNQMMKVLYHAAISRTKHYGPLHLD